jgi:uncharacterized protein
MATIKNHIRELFKVNGLKTAIIVGRDGLVLEAVSNDAREDVEAVGASLSHALVSSDTRGNDLGVGRLNQGIEEHEDGVLVTSALGKDALLCLVCEGGVNLGMIRFQVKKITPGILDLI